MYWAECFLRCCMLFFAPYSIYFNGKERLRIYTQCTICIMGEFLILYLVKVVSYSLPNENTTRSKPSLIDGLSLNVLWSIILQEIFQKKKKPFVLCLLFRILKIRSPVTRKRWPNMLTIISFVKVRTQAHWSTMICRTVLVIIVSKCTVLFPVDCTYTYLQICVNYNQKFDFGNKKWFTLSLWRGKTKKKRN